MRDKVFDTKFYLLLSTYLSSPLIPVFGPYLTYFFLYQVKYPGRFSQEVF